MPYKSAIPLFCRSCTNQLVGPTNVKCQRKKQEKFAAGQCHFLDRVGFPFFSHATVCLSNAKKQKLQHLLSCLMVENRRVERKLVEQVIGLLLWYCGGASRSSQSMKKDECSGAWAGVRSIHV